MLCRATMSRVVRTRYRVSENYDKDSYVQLPEEFVAQQRYLDAVRRKVATYTSVWDVQIVEEERATAVYMEAYLQHPDAELNSQQSGRAYLSEVVAENRLDLIGVLLRDARVDVNAPNEDDGFTPLMEACSYKSVEAVRMLLQRQDLDVNYTDEDNKFALYEAAWQGGYHVVLALLEDPRVNAHMRIPGSRWTAVDAAVEGCLDALENMPMTTSEEDKNRVVNTYTAIIEYLTHTWRLDYDKNYMQFFRRRVLQSDLRY